MAPGLTPCVRARARWRALVSRDPGPRLTHSAVPTPTPRPLQSIAANAAALAALGGLPAAVAALTAAVMAINPPALLATTVTRAADIALAREANKHDHRGVPLVAVPTAAGVAPAFWPAAGFDRADLFEQPIAPVDALLAGYGLPVVGDVMARRNALARHLGTMRTRDTDSFLVNTSAPRSHRSSRAAASSRELLTRARAAPRSPRFARARAP